MTNTLTLVMAVLLFCIQAKSQKKFFVKEGSHGSGTSWSDASGDLSQTLRLAKSGDVIWVSKGRYTPGTGRESSFVVGDGVCLLGGFSGLEELMGERDFRRNVTILSGEIGNPGIADNVYNVVFTQKVSATTLVDGFTITGGNADGTGPIADRHRCGGGWYNDGSAGISNPRIANCTFIANEARDGAGMFNNGQAGHASPTLAHCTFRENHADLDGGALYNYGTNGGNSNPEFLNCLIARNKANYGGGMFNNGGGGRSSPVLRNCILSANLAYVRGGALLNMDLGGESIAILDQCDLSHNEATVGEGVYQFSAMQGNVLRVRIGPEGRF
jgi:hypothetical protein